MPPRSLWKISLVMSRALPLNSRAHTIGGCGEKYAVLIVSQQFAGLSMLKQHKLVTAALKDEIAGMHALRIFTQEKEE